MENNKKRKLLTVLSTRASFLKVFDADFSNSLTLPRAFIKHFNGDIPQWFILEIAGTRKGWRVDTKVNTNGGFFLDYGWSEFVEDQSLQVGDILLFECEEDPLILQLKIFEKDGSEKSAATNLELGRNVDEIPKAHCVNEDDIWSTRPSTYDDRHKTFQDDIDQIQMETATCDDRRKQFHEDIDGIEMEADCDYGIHEKQHQKDVNGMHVKSDDLCRLHEKRLKIFERTDRGKRKGFETEQGACYSIIWRRVSHMYYYLTLPRISVAKTKLSGDETVVLKDQDGRTWPVKLRKRPAGRVDLAQGWKEFLIENNIKSGDILTFEFTSDNVINIHIERSSRNDVPPEMATKSEPMDSFDENHDLCEEPVVNYTKANHNATETETTKLKTERVFFDNFMPSSFSVTWKHSFKTSYLHIPRPIARKQKLENNDTVVIQDPEGKQWRMKIRTRPSDGRVALTKGWDTFWKRHKISSGDTLVCEFVSDHIMKVNIVRLSPSYASCGVEPAMKREVMQLD